MFLKWPFKLNLKSGKGEFGYLVKLNIQNQYCRNDNTNTDSLWVCYKA